MRLYLDAPHDIRLVIGEEHLTVKLSFFFYRLSGCDWKRDNTACFNQQSGSSDALCANNDSVVLLTPVDFLLHAVL